MTVERRDQTARGRAVREAMSDWIDHPIAALLARMYDAGHRDASAELVAEFQAVIAKLRADITQDKPPQSATD